MCCDEWAHNAPATVDCSAVCGSCADSGRCQDDLPIGCSSPEMVRITLISRTASPDPTNKKGSRPAAEDRPAGTSDDDLTETQYLGTFLRSVLTTMVKLHNMSS
jgi:hypothetical protein